MNFSIQTISLFNYSQTIIMLLFWINQVNTCVKGDTIHNNKINTLSHFGEEHIVNRRPLFCANARYTNAKNEQRRIWRSMETGKSWHATLRYTLERETERRDSREIVDEGKVTPLLSS